MSGASITAEPPVKGAPPSAETGRWRKYAVAAAFLAPAAVLLGVWIVYPTVKTIIRSLFDRSGEKFVGLDNYETIFTADTLQRALLNNLIWVLVVPMFVTTLGLIFAVLTERVRWSVAFKTVVFKIG